MTAPDRDEEFEAFLKRRTLLPNVIERLEPPEHLDAAVLEQAREAIRGERQSKATRAQRHAARWARPVALAATILLCLSIVLNVTLNTNRPDAGVQRMTVANADKKSESVAAPAANSPAAIAPAPTVSAGGGRPAAPPAAASDNLAAGATDGPTGGDGARRLAAAGSSRAAAGGAGDRVTGGAGNLAADGERRFEQAPKARRDALAENAAPASGAPVDAMADNAAPARGAAAGPSVAATQGAAVRHDQAQGPGSARSASPRPNAAVEQSDAQAASADGARASPPPSAMAGAPTRDEPKRELSASTSDVQRQSEGAEASAAAAPLASERAASESKPAWASPMGAGAVAGAASGQVEADRVASNGLDERQAKLAKRKADTQPPHPQDPKVWLQQIQTLRSQGKTAQAEAEMQRFRAAFPNYPLEARPP